jgi:hypothetical protein
MCVFYFLICTTSLLHCKIHLQPLASLTLFWAVRHIVLSSSLVIDLYNDKLQKVLPEDNLQKFSVVPIPLSIYLMALF